MAAAPKRIQRRRTKGWRMPSGAVYVGRPTRYGNPFTIGCNAYEFSMGVPYTCPQTMDQVLADYRYFVNTWLILDPDFLKPLRDKDLACWCPPEAKCHVDVLLEMANSSVDNCTRTGA